MHICIYTNINLLQKGKITVLQTAEKRMDSKNEGEIEGYKHLNSEFQRIEGEIRKLSSAINAKK